MPRPLRRLLRPVVDAVLSWILLPPATAVGTLLWAAAAPAEQVMGQPLAFLLQYCHFDVCEPAGEEAECCSLLSLWLCISLAGDLR